MDNFYTQIYLVYSEKGYFLNLKYGKPKFGENKSEARIYQKIGTAKGIATKLSKEHKCQFYVHSFTIGIPTIVYSTK